MEDARALDKSARMEFSRLISEVSWEPLYWGWDVSTHFVRGFVRSILLVALRGVTRSIFRYVFLYISMFFNMLEVYF